MRFNELKKYKDGRVVKPRDPNWKQMQDLKKSGASGSHGDKTKEIPRKAKYKDQDIEESPIKQDRDNPIAKPYVDTPEWKALHDMDDKIIQAYNKHKKSVSEGDDRIPRLLGITQAHLGYGLDMAKNILDGKVQQAENMARIVVESWPEAIDRIQNIYKRDSMYTDAEHISEFIDDRVGTVVKTTQGKRVKIVRADPKAGMYKVDLGNGHEKWVTTKQLDLEVPTDALGKKAKPRDWKHPWDSIGEAKEKMCPEACCGVPVSECHCPPDCPHCDCNAIKEDLDSPSHKAQSSIWHKNNPIGRNFMDPDDYDSDAEGTHIIMDNPTELHFYKVPAKNYDEAFDLWLDSKGRQPSDSEYYDSTKDYASDHQYWGRIAPDEPEPEDDDWSDEDEKEFGTAARDLTNVPGRKYDADDDKEAKDEKESLTTEQIAEILEADFGVKDIEDYKAKIKTLYGLERYMQSDPELAQEVKRRYRQLAAWKIEYDKEHEEDYETQIYDAIKTETATAGSTSAGNIATVVNPTQAYGHRPKDKKGLPKAPQKKKADGTAVNALDMGNNLMGGATVKR
jgi:hypothetical protein